MIGAILGVAGNIAQTAINNQMAAQAASQGRYENWYYNEKSAQAADTRTRALYNDFYSPAALMQQYKGAGLSPSMMFGGTPGQGGSQGAQGAGASGPGQPFMPISLLEGAQATNLLADAEYKKEQAKELRGENEFGKAEIAKIDQETQTNLAEKGLKEAETAYRSLMSYWQEIQNSISDKTKPDQVRKIVAEADTQEAQADYWDRMAELTNLEFDFQTETYQTRVEKLNNENKLLIANIIKTMTESSLNETKQQELITNCEMRYLEYLQEQEKILVSKMEATAKMEQIKINYRNLILDYNRLMQDALGKDADIIIQEKKMYMSLLGDIIKTAGGAAAFMGAKGKISGKRK